MTPPDDDHALMGALPVPLASALAAQGYATLTPVQLAMLEPGRADADLLVSAQTGSGKTVAFGMAIAPTLLWRRRIFDTAGAACSDHRANPRTGHAGAA